MITTFVKHEVKDFSNWKHVYDDFMPTAKAKGVKEEHVFRDSKAPEQVIVTHVFQNIKDANEFFNSDELRNAMKNAGVVGKPEIWFGEDVKKDIH